MKYYIIAGEASGDLHGANLIRALKKQDPKATFRVWGGDLMQAANNDIPLIKHYRESAFMGFVEVLKNLPTIWTNLRFCKADILDYQPDSVILIDYAGFNLRIAAYAKKAGFKVFYYISPKVWIWNEGRVKKLKKYVDKMFVIFPFEEKFYQKKWQWPAAQFVGNPLIEAVDEAQKNWTTSSINHLKTSHSLDDRPIIALLAGSRKQEVRKILPIMIKTASRFPDYQFIVAGAPGLSLDFYEKIIEKCNIPNVMIVQNKTYLLLSLAKAALVTSGTATLEAALFDVPQIVCYKTNILTYFLAKLLIYKKIRYISLVNLILEKEAVRELIQDQLKVKLLRVELKFLLKEKKMATILEDYALLKKKLGGLGASQRAAKAIVEDL